MILPVPDMTRPCELIFQEFAAEQTSQPKEDTVACPCFARMPAHLPVHMTVGCFVVSKLKSEWNEGCSRSSLAGFGAHKKGCRAQRVWMQASEALTWTEFCKWAAEHVCADICRSTRNVVVDTSTCGSAIRLLPGLDLPYMVAQNHQGYGASRI